MQRVKAGGVGAAGMIVHEGRSRRGMWYLTQPGKTALAIVGLPIYMRMLCENSNGSSLTW